MVNKVLTLLRTCKGEATGKLVQWILALLPNGLQLGLVVRYSLLAR